MNRLIPYLWCAALLIAGVSSSCAVEKKQKENASNKTTQELKKDSTDKAVKAAPKKPDAKTTPQQKDAKAKTEKKYDNFVDKNNNGVDDRRENLKKKETK